MHSYSSAESKKCGKLNLRYYSASGMWTTKPQTGGRKNVKSPNFKLLHPFVSYIIMKIAVRKRNKHTKIKKGKTLNLKKL